MRYFKKALVLSAFFYSPVTTALDCPASHYDETAVVKSVHDGDTLKLIDGRKVRLIGINTPELARNNQAAQPYARQARQALLQLVNQSDLQIRLVYGAQREDRYQRTLAHLYLPDGQNIQAALIRQGMATAFTTPPNDRQSRCYRQLESKAIDNKKGIWSLTDYQLYQIHELGQNSKGFHRIQGSVTKAYQSPGGFWLILDNRLRVHIKQQDLTYFDISFLQQLTGKMITVRGWLHPKKKSYFMNLRHPDALRLIPPSGH